MNTYKKNENYSQNKMNAIIDMYKYSKEIGDRKLMQRQMDKFYMYIHKYIYRVCWDSYPTLMKSRMHGEDLIQEIWVKIMEEIDKYDYQKASIKDLPSWAIVMIKKTGIAFLYHKKIMLADKILLKYFDDYFGISHNAAQPSIWRDMHLAHLFRERAFANAVFRNREGYKILIALHSTKLDGIETDVREIVLYYLNEKKVEIYEFSYDEIHFEVEILFPMIVKNNWILSLTIRDSNIGRESLTFYSGWRKQNGLIYIDELKVGHRKAVKMFDIIMEVNRLIKNTEDAFRLPVFIDANDIKNSLKHVLGKAKTKRFDKYLVEICTEEDLLCMAASYIDEAFYDRQLIEFRSSLGVFLKEGKDVKNS